MRLKPLAVFRADATPQIGAGHVMRCLTLAERLRQEGWDTAIAIGRDGGDAMPAFTAQRLDLVTLDVAATDEAVAMAARWPGGCDLLVVDNYGRDAEFERACRPWAAKILVFDDLLDRTHDSDFLVDPAPGRGGDDYARIVPDGCLRLLGPAYLPLRPGFARARETVLSRRGAGGTPRRILVSFGATDPDNVTADALQAVAGASIDCAVDILLGRGAPHVRAVRALAETSLSRAVLHEALDDVVPLLAASDLALGAGGIGALERCCLGLPSVVACTAANQRATAAGLAAAGAAHVVGDESGASVDAMAKGLGRLLADPDERDCMTRAASVLCDGLGAARIVQAVAPLRARDGRAVRLRPVVAADEARLLDWQQAPSTRQFARDPSVPTSDDHAHWFAARLAAPCCIFNIVLHGETPAGVVRLDRREAQEDYEVSIFIAPDRMRQGLGSAALTLIRRLLPETVFWAEVLPGNEASHALFQRAGYGVENGGYVSRPAAIFRQATRPLDVVATDRGTGAVR